MDRNQIIVIIIKQWKREVSQAVRNIVALRRPRRKLRKNSLIVSISFDIYYKIRFLT